MCGRRPPAVTYPKTERAGRLILESVLQEPRFKPVPGSGPCPCLISPDGWLWQPIGVRCVPRSEMELEVEVAREQGRSLPGLRRIADQFIPFLACRDIVVVDYWLYGEPPPTTAQVGTRFFVGFDPDVVQFDSGYSGSRALDLERFELEADSLVGQLAEVNRRCAERRQGMERERQLAREKVLEPGNFRCDELASRMSSIGMRCPHCHVVSNDMRYLDGRPDHQSLLICRRCGCSIRPGEVLPE